MSENGSDVRADLKFSIGQRVQLTLAPEVDAIVTAYCVRGRGITYECCWFHEGKQIRDWFVPEMLEESPNAKRIGF